MRPLTFFCTIAVLVVHVTASYRDHHVRLHHRNDWLGWTTGTPSHTQTSSSCTKDTSTASHTPTSSARHKDVSTVTDIPLITTVTDFVTTTVTTTIFEIGGYTTTCTLGQEPSTIVLGSYTTVLWPAGGSNGGQPGSPTSTAQGYTPGFANGYSGVGLSGLPASLSSLIFNPTVIASAPIRPSDIHRGKGSLSQQAQNGNSNLGTCDSPTLPPFVGANTNGSDLPSTPPWNSGSANPYDAPPDTGVTRTYNFNVARATLAPDGFQRSMMVINGAFPGPVIEANWGDTIQVTVTNSITGPEEGTSIHWHGLLQTNSQWMDGVPGVMQCPIAPGESFTYSFIADLYGTSWYHSHYSAQLASGVVGAMVIHGPTNADYDIDLGPVVLSDYFHKEYYTIVEEIMGTNLSLIAPQSVNNLINGKGSYNCSLVTDNSTCTSDAGYSKFSFTSGMTYRLRLVNVGAEAIQKFSIDNHQLTVIAYDFVPIQPYTTTVVTLAVGQRADVIVTANLTSTSAVWMRSTISKCSLTTQPYGYGMVYYQHANTSALPSSSAWTDNTSPCANDDLALTVPYYPMTPPNASTTQDIIVDFEVNKTGHFLWTMNGSPFRVDYNDPILMLAAQGNDSYPYDPEWNVYDFGTNTSIRVVVYNPTPVAHPMHLHGHNMYILAEGTTTDSDWDGTIVNAANPTRRDVQLLQPNGYLVMQFDANNPGVWPFHCHIAWHVSGGLYVNLLENPDRCGQLDYPSEFTDLCRTWSSFTNNDYVDQIDSGL